jgi:molybdopterin-guanine dinucleotide biosynthesis protein B
MKKTLVIGIYGESNTGKTKLLERLINQLTNDGYSVGSIKITDKEISVDTPGKDTWKHREAGSKITVFSSKIETSFMVREQMKIDKIIDSLEKLGHFDIILIEGANDQDTPKIKIGNVDKRENTIFTYTGDFEKIHEMIKTKLIGGK